MREAADRSGSPVADRAPDGCDRTSPAVASTGLVVRYGPTVAVDGLSFAAHPGEVVAILGPNGAGKTSTVECLEGYRPAAAGRASVLGHDPRRERAAVVPRIGVMLQRGGAYPMLGARRLLRLFAAYYDEPADPDALLEQVGLSGVATTPWRRLSGGEQQRLSLALALVGRPDVLFLDEPTAGVDPEGRLVVRDLVGDRRQAGVCVVLTTHELAEAERMADRVVIVDRGHKLAEGAPADLSAPVPPTVRFRAGPGLAVVSLAEAIGGGAVVVEEEAGQYRVDLLPATEEAAAVAALTAWLAAAGHTLSDLRTGRSLEEAYLAITRQAAGAGGTAGSVTRSATSADGADAADGSDGAPPTEPLGADGRPGRTVAAVPRSPSRRLAGRPLRAQLGAELFMMASNGETLLLTLGIPVVFLLFFSSVHVLPVGPGRPVDFLVPGILALAVMSTAMTALGIGTGFDRGYGVLKRLATTPLGRPRLLEAKILTVVAVELVQAAVLVAVGVGLGWSPGRGGPAASAAAAAAMVLGTVAFCGIGLLAAGTLKPLVNLAVLNTLFVVLLLLGGMLVPLAKLPAGLADLARVLPASALADALHRTLGTGLAVSARDWAVLAVWAVVAPVLAGAFFRWE